MEGNGGAKGRQALAALASHSWPILLLYSMSLPRWVHRYGLYFLSFLYIVSYPLFRLSFLKQRDARMAR